MTIETMEIPKLLKIWEVSFRTGLSKRQLAYRRKVGGGPKPTRTNDGRTECKTGRLIRYREDEVAAYVATHIKGSVRELYSSWKCNEDGNIGRPNQGYVGPGENPPDREMFKRRPRHHDIESPLHREWRQRSLAAGIQLDSDHMPPDYIKTRSLAPRRRK